MKRILLITTGGTIASKPTSDGLAPSVTSEEILEYIPEVTEICSITTYGLFNLDSTNICYQHWIAIVKCLKEHYTSYDGFVKRTAPTQWHTLPPHCPTWYKTVKNQ